MKKKNAFYDALRWRAKKHGLLQGTARVLFVRNCLAVLATEANHVARTANTQLRS